MIIAMTLVNSEVAITLQYLTFRDQFLSLLHTSSCSTCILTVARSVHAPYRMDFKPHTVLLETKNFRHSLSISVRVTVGGLGVRPEFLESEKSTEHINTNYYISIRQDITVGSPGS